MYADELEQIVQTVFSTMFDMELFRSEDSELGDSPPLLATVQIAGAWSGDIVLEFSAELIGSATSKMLNRSASELTTEDRQEVASELANMIGGNLKSILPAPSVLSIPTIASREVLSQQRTGNSSDELTLGSADGCLRVSIYS